MDKWVGRLPKAGWRIGTGKTAQFIKWLPYKPEDELHPSTNIKKGEKKKKKKPDMIVLL